MQDVKALELFLQQAPTMGFGRVLEIKNPREVSWVGYVNQELYSSWIPMEVLTAEEYEELELGWFDTVIVRDCVPVGVLAAEEFFDALTMFVDPDFFAKRIVIYQSTNSPHYQLSMTMHGLTIALHNDYSFKNSSFTMQCQGYPSDNLLVVDTTIYHDEALAEFIRGGS